MALKHSFELELCIQMTIASFVEYRTIKLYHENSNVIVCIGINDKPQNEKLRNEEKVQFPLDYFLSKQKFSIMLIFELQVYFINYKFSI